MARCPSCGVESGDQARFCANCGQSLVSRVAVEGRRHVTALFADLVASTATSDRFDPEVVRGYVSRFFEAAQSEVEGRGGSVEKFSGDAVLALFGLQTAHEDDPERAVRAALAIQGALAQLSAQAEARHGLELKARIGLEAGEVVVGDPFGGATIATGDPLNLAARLEQLATPGETVVGPAVHSATARAFRFDPMGERQLAGKLEPRAVWRVIEPVAAVGEARGIEGLSAPLTGRDKEMALLLDTAARVASERKAVLYTVLGVPGVGKSRLVREAAQRLEADGWRVIRGRCLPYGEGITYWPVGEMVRGVAGIQPEQDAEAALERLRATVRDGVVAERLAFAMGLSPGLAIIGEGIDAEIAWAFRALTEQLAGDQPIVLVFEDIHWAESVLLDLIEHMALWVRDMPLLIICLARPELLDVRPHWGAGRVEASRIHLEPLTREETTTLISEALRIESLPDGLRDRILDRAEGNPLFVEETIWMLIEGGQISRHGERWAAADDIGDLQVPDSIEALIRARLDHVPPGERVTLQAASVIGRVFHIDAVAKLVNGPVTGHLEDAVLRDLLTREPGLEGDYRFRHVLIRDVAYTSLPKARRAVLHAAFVSWLSDWAGDRQDEFVEIEAYHLEQAVLLRRELEGSVDPQLVERAVATLERSAQKAASRDEWRSVAKFAERALALGPEPAARHAELDALLLDGLAELEDYRRARPLAEHLRAESEAVGRSDLHGWALHVIGMEIWFDVQGPENRNVAVALLRKARSELETAGDRKRLFAVIMALADEPWQAGDVNGALALFREAASIADEIGDRSSQITALGEIVVCLIESGVDRHTEAEATLTEMEDQAAASSRLTQARVQRVRGHQLFWTGGDPKRGEHLVRSALRIHEELGTRRDELRALERLAGMLRNQGDFRQSLELTKRHFRLAKDIGERAVVPEAARKLSEAYLAAGDVASAERYAVMSRELVADDDVWTVNSSQLALGRVRDQQRRDAEAEQLLNASLATIEATYKWAEEVHAALAEYHLRRGRWDPGDWHAQQAADLSRRHYGELSLFQQELQRRFEAAREIGRQREQSDERAHHSLAES